MKMIHNYIGIAICIISLQAVSVMRAEAVPVSFGDNHYDFIQVSDPFTGSNNTWATAKTAAAASVYNSVNGHLATITSQEENDFLIGLVTTTFTGFNGAWLGGNYQGWLDGPEASKTFSEVGGYTNWNQVEPNNSGLMYMSIGTSTPNTGSAGKGKWLDDSGIQGLPEGPDPVIGYFVEYEDTATVPEPATMLMLGTGLIGLAGVRRKFKK